MSVELIHMDCLKYMRDMKSGYIDLTVTSPPYDNLRDYGGHQFSEGQWKDCISELYRITKIGGIVVWVVGDQCINGSETGTSFKQALWAMECGFKLHDTMIYQKYSCAFPEAVRYYQQFEYMFVLSKGKPKTINLITDKENIYRGKPMYGTNRQKDGSVNQISRKGAAVKDFGIRYNVWKIPHDSKTGERHPAIFPLRLAQDHIVSWSNVGDLVFDPFSGSGTTGEACINLDRNFIGTEIHEDYYSAACKHFEQMTRQEVLF